SINLSSSTQEAPDNGLLTRLYTFRPDLPVYDANGNYSFSRYNNFENPVAMAQIRNTNKTHLLIGSVFGELNFATNFLLRSTLSINYNIGNFRSYSPGFTSAGGFTRASGNGPGLAQESNNNTLTHLWENTLTYTNRFGQDHSLEAILGASWQGDENRFLKASGKGFPESSILNNLSSATSDFTVGSGSSQSGLISYFGRVNYTFKDRYMLSFSARADGSSKFAEENKWAFFPTVAGAWRISDEDFLEGVNFINELKLRASTGVTGQANFGAYQWRTLFGSTSYGGAPAVTQNQLGNSRLKWELTNQTDIGLDFSLFDYRLSGSFDYYVKNTSDLLYFTNLPGSTGEIRAIGNLGNTQNRGVEITLEGDIIRSNNFNWNLSVNASRNRNKLVSLNEDFTDKSTGIITPPNTGSKLKVGEPLGLIYGYVADGLFRTQEELDALNAAAGTGLYYQAAATRPGDIKFRDLNGDNRVTVADQDIIGNANPDLVGGFTNTFQFKGFSLSALFTYSIGNDLRWGTMATATTFLSTGSENKIALVMDRWTPDNPDATIPRVAYGDPANNGRVSSFYVYDASYLRLKNINLTYTFPQEILSKTRFIRTADIYVNALNLATFTKYPGANPEVSNLYDDDVSTGLDNSRFPISKAFTIGIRLGF
ncbi:MAG TPA: SusC/RagA family TonB-linked outer membrane protein, partial [Parasegetibacter sp.]